MITDKIGMYTIRAEIPLPIKEEGGNKVILRSDRTGTLKKKLRRYYKYTYLVSFALTRWRAVTFPPTERALRSGATEESSA